MRNPHYWGGWSGKHFKKIIIRQVPEDSDRRQGMESGDFDISFPSTPQDTEALKNTPGIFVGARRCWGWSTSSSADYGPLASPLARQAINLLFPSDQFVSSVMKGTLDTPNSVLPDLMLYAAPGTYKPALDVAKAKALLQQAGVKPGTQLTYEFYTGHRKEPGLVLQNQLQQIRAEAEPRREGLPGVRRRHLHPQAGVAAARHGVVVLVARVQQPVRLLLPHPVRGRDAEAEPVQRRLLHRTTR